MQDFGFVKKLKLKRLHLKNYGSFLLENDTGGGVLFTYFDFEKNTYVTSEFNINYGDESYLDIIGLINKLNDVSSKYEKDKKFFFKNQLHKLKLLKAKTKKGFFSILYKDLNLYVNKLMIFGFLLSTRFMERIEQGLFHLKRTRVKNKSLYGYKAIRNNNDIILCLSNKKFYIRDFIRMMTSMNDGSNNEIEDNKKIMKDYFEEMKLPITNNDMENNMTLFKLINSILIENFNNYSLLFSNCCSIASVGYDLLASQSVRNNFLDFSTFRLSLSSYMIMTKFLKGGLISNYVTLAYNNQFLRQSLNYYDPVKKLLIYDICSCYASSFYESEQPIGQIYRYDTNIQHPDELILKRDLYSFRAERDFVLLFLWKHITKLEYEEILTTFHHYNSLGQFSISNYSLDLTIITRNRTTRKIHYYFYNFHHFFSHTCERCLENHRKSCPLLANPSSSSSSSSSSSKNCDCPSMQYRSKMSYDELKLYSDNNDQLLRELLRESFEPDNNFSYEIIYSCCYFSMNQGVLDPTTSPSTIYYSIQDFILSCPAVWKYRINYKLPHKMKKNQLYSDLATDKLLNCYVIAKITIPKQYRSASNGYVISKTCSGCKFRKESHIKDHKPRLICGHNNSNYSLFNGETINFLINERNAIIDDISHVFVFATGTSHRIFLDSCIKLRYFYLKHDQKLLSSLFKNLVNSAIGLQQSRPNKVRNVTHLCEYFKEGDDIQSICNTESGKYFYVKRKKKPLSWASVYFMQKNITSSIQILEQSKLNLLRIINFTDKCFMSSTFRLIRINVDSIYVLITEDDLESCVIPGQEKFYKTYRNKYFTDSKKNVYCLGKMYLENSYSNFVFTSMSNTTYNLKSDHNNNNNNNNDNYSLLKNVNFQFLKTLNKKDRIKIENSYDSFPI